MKNSIYLFIGNLIGFFGTLLCVDVPDGDIETVYLIGMCAWGCLYPSILFALQDDDNSYQVFEETETQNEAALWISAGIVFPLSLTLFCLYWLVKEFCNLVKNFFSLPPK